MAGTVGPKPWECVDRDVARRYRVLRKIGRGCYGVVWEAARAGGPARGGAPGADAPEDRAALKKVLHAFRDGTDAQRTYREVSYMLHFGDHDNILRLREVMVASNDMHLYLFTDLLDSDLQKAIRCTALQPIHRPLIAYQVLRALKYIHSASVMHRDVKPSNILLRNSGEAQLADFGWARAAPEVIEPALVAPMTEYASTRWYRAPEMLCGGRLYTTAVDMWAMACVIAEMHSDRPLLGGSSTLDMLTKIEEMIGKPLAHDIEAMEAPYVALAFELAPPGPPSRPVGQWVLDHGGNEDPELEDILQLLLQYSPAKRMLVTEALTHPYVGAFHNPDREPEFGRPLLLEISDEEKAPASHYRDQIYADVIGRRSAKIRVADEARERLLRHGPPGAAGVSVEDV